MSDDNFRKLNCDKSCVFTDNRTSQRRSAEPTALPDMVRCRSLKMLGVVIADDFSLTQHVQQLVTSSAQTDYALRVLRCQRGSAARATVVARLTYAASAWRGLTKVSDRQPINSVLDRARRLGYCSPHLR